MLLESIKSERRYRELRNAVYNRIRSLVTVNYNYYRYRRARIMEILLHLLLALVTFVHSKLQRTFNIINKFILLKTVLYT